MDSINKKEELINLSPKIPTTRKEIVKIFGEIKYVSMKNGNIKITNNFERENIVRVDLPIVGRKAIHKLLVIPFTRALQAIEDVGKAEKIKTFGTWAPRVTRTSLMRLSFHSWGIAADINAKENPMRAQSKLDPIIIECFKNEGFSWGGDWKSFLDCMHFEYFRRKEVVKA